ncbi:MAG: hypothetical protein J1F31_01945 [Erysipelotrichales bacterium]|nr:hypothetical protein [Erysipelotrichales bacterium]
MSNGLFLVAGLLIGGMTLSNKQIGDNVDIAKFESLNYIVEHMKEFNEVRMDEGYAPTSVDFIKPVPINTVDGEKLDGRLLKLNEGYILFGEDEKIHEISHINNIDIDKSAKLEFYDIGGFVEYDKATGEFVPISEKNKDDVNATTPTIYDGQSSSGEGCIYDPELYVLSRYGEGYNLYQSYEIRSPLDRSVRALNASIVELGQYRTNLGANAFVDEDIYGLIDATILADFISLNYEFRFGRNLSFIYNCEENEPELYEYKTTHGWWWTKNYVSKLYMLLRKHMYDEYGRLELLTRDQVKETILWFANEYNYPLSLSEDTSIWRSMYLRTDFFNKTLNQDRIMIVDISNSKTYSELVGVGVGYRIYQKISYIVGVEVVQQAYLLDFKDSFNYGPNYLDISSAGVACKTITMITSPESFNA